jgi:hypothetical protein
VPDPAFNRRGKRRFDDDEPTFAKRSRHRSALPAMDALDTVGGPPEGDRWSTWDQSAAGERGPRPYPDWLVTELAAVDTELGILKTGKEADVFLLSRGVPGTGRHCLLAANGTGTPITGCSIATASTWKAGESASLVIAARWPTARQPGGR